MKTRFKSQLLLASLCLIGALALLASRNANRLRTFEEDQISPQEISLQAIKFYTQSKHSVAPQAGLVPDKSTAVAVALAVWKPIYGAEIINREAPFKATLAGETWFVTGTLPRGRVGGVAFAQISKKDGRVVRVRHGM